MKTLPIMGLALLSWTISSCTSTKTSNNTMLFDGTWEMEYITGPRIAFEGLYPNKKPQLSFDKEMQQVQGTNSCNGYSADFEINEDKISFGEPGPTTMMYCGEGEQVFLNTMEKVNEYKIDTNGKLILAMDDVPLMRFKKLD